jgi:hypothetical protein
VYRKNRRIFNSKWLTSGSAPYGQQCQQTAGIFELYLQMPNLWLEFQPFFKPFRLSMWHRYVNVCGFHIRMCFIPDIEKFGRERTAVCFLEVRVSVIEPHFVYECDSRRGLGLDIGFLDHCTIQLGIASNYSTNVNIHTLHITTAHAKSFPACRVFTSVPR